MRRLGNSASTDAHGVSPYTPRTTRVGGGRRCGSGMPQCENFGIKALLLLPSEQART
jgi:hypothetical protein